MQMYASSAGKSGGEYYTPQEVSELLARITVVGKTEVNKVYDPACGSGSLLLKFAKVLGHGQRPPGLLRPGDQPDHLQPVPDQHVPARRELRAVRHRPRRHADRPGALGRRAVRGDRVQPAVLDQVGRRRQPAAHQRPALRARRRARAEVARPTSPSRCTSCSWLAVNGTAAIVEFPGVLYRGGAEQKIRKYLVDNNYVDTVIQLPPDLFFGTTIATCIIVLKKSKTDNKIAVHRRLRRVRPPGQQEQAHRATTSRRSSTPSPPARTSTHFATLVDNADDRRQRLQHRRLARTSRPRTPARPSTSPRSTPRSRASSRGRPSCAPRSTRSSPTWRDDQWWPWRWASGELNGNEADAGRVECRGPGAATRGLHRVRSQPSWASRC